MVKRALGRVSSPAILVGHSYGGSVITAAGTDDRVVGLVYIAAVALDVSETTQGQLDNFPPTGVFSHIEVAKGRVWLEVEAELVRRSQQRRNCPHRSATLLGKT
jgi:pimeloyl-ACP methyl ester carboxylesterase